MLPSRAMKVAWDRYVREQCVVPSIGLTVDPSRMGWPDGWLASIEPRFAQAFDALEALDTPDDDEAVQRALVFVSRCQNLPSKYNETKFPELNPDGGFYYTIAQGGSSQAGALPNGGLRSYGSMTYAGLKSMLYAGVDKEDPRVKAAVEWLQQHYSLEENPGMGDSGLYYYFHTFAKALDAYGQSNFVEKDGDEHDWKQELVAALAARQQENGSWVNSNERWLEADPNLATGYVLLALSYVK